MQYQDTVDDSRKYLRLALEQIGKHGLPTDPLNYSIWYEYASGKNAELSAAIDHHIETKGTFSDDIVRALFNKYIANSKEIANALVRDELRKVFGRIMGAVKTTNLQYSDSENNLETINRSLALTMSEGDVEMIVNQISQEIKSLESTNSSFRKQLNQATSEIDQLKIKMERYRNESIKDPLTRIDNRRGFDMKLSQAMDDANAEGTSLCMIMADVDYFKKINDTHGHLVGDNVIRMVAATIKESIKGRDLVARIGGEEFAIILPNTPFEGAMKLADNMRLAFERLDLKKKNTGESLGKITLSFGVTDFNRDETANDFVNRADKALYQSKKTGRNKVSGLHP